VTCQKREGEGMGRLSEHHKALKDGIGKCSVPMWQMGIPAGFCDQDAFGYPTKEGILRYDGYVPALACPFHGGPSRIVRDLSADGNVDPKCAEKEDNS
jgi:hypothetical protein